MNWILKQNSLEVEPISSRRGNQKHSGKSLLLLPLIESDRIGKLRFKKIKEGASMPRIQKILQECLPGPCFWSNSKLFRNSFIRVGRALQVVSWFPAWGMHSERQKLSKQREILSQQTSSHIEPSGKRRNAAYHFFRIIPTFSSLLHVNNVQFKQICQSCICHIKYTCKGILISHLIVHQVFGIVFFVRILILIRYLHRCNLTGAFYTHMYTRPTNQN